MKQVYLFNFQDMHRIMRAFKAAQATQKNPHFQKHFDMIMDRVKLLLQEAIPYELLYGGEQIYQNVHTLPPKMLGEVESILISKFEDFEETFTKAYNNEIELPFSPNALPKMQRLAVKFLQTVISKNAQS